MKNINYKPAVEKGKNILLAAFIFGGLGAYVGIQYTYSVDTRTDDRVNAILKANKVVTTVEAAQASVSPSPSK